MGYRENAVYYRQQFHNSINAGKLTEAKIYSVAYSKLLRSVAEQISSYVDRAAVIVEATKYEKYAIALLNEGISDRIKYAVKHNLPLSPKDSDNSSPDISIPVITPSAKVQRTHATAPTAIQYSSPIQPPATLLHSTDVEWSADMFDKYNSATVEIYGSNGSSSWSGTGFFISETGLLLTNHHVAYTSSMTLAEELRIKSGDGKISTTASVIASDIILRTGII